MKTRCQHIFLLSILFLLTFTPALNSNAQRIDDFRPPLEEKFLEWQGSYGGLKEPKVMVIKDQDTWDGIYRMISGGGVKLSLDFSHYMVIAIFMGEKRTGGYSVNILRAEEMDGVEVMEYTEKGKGKVRPLSQIAKKVFVVEYEEISPGPNSLITMAITSPYHIKAVRRSDLPVVFVKYEKVMD